MIPLDEIERIKKIVRRYRRLYGTNDPFEIADRIGVLYQIGDIGCAGCYMFLKNHRYIFLNRSLDHQEARLVMAHELAHAIFDRKDNCYFIRGKTLLLNAKSERRANRFAAYLLLTDEIMDEYRGYTKEYLAAVTGYPEEFIDLRLN